MEKSINDYYVINGNVENSRNFSEEKVIGKTNIYEVIRIIDGVPLFLEAHLNRMKKTFELMNISDKLNIDSIKNTIDKLLISNDKAIGNIKIIYALEKNTLSAYYIKHVYPNEELYREGVKTILFYGERKNPNAKIIDNNFRKKVNKDIKENEAYEAILVDNKRQITEGSRSNIFMIKDDYVITSPVESVLPGVTRGKIINVCNKLNIEVKEEYLKDSDLKNIDGLFISGTSPKVLPISKIDNYEYKSNSNDIILSIMKAYNCEVEEYTRDRK